MKIEDLQCKRDKLFANVKRNEFHQHILNLYVSAQCDIHDDLEKFSSFCTKSYNEHTEDQANYCKGKFVNLKYFDDYHLFLYLPTESTSSRINVHKQCSLNNEKQE